MLTYVPPTRDIRFVTEEWLDLPRQWADMPAFSGLDAETFRQIVEQAGRFASEVLLPINAAGDLEGCHYTDGTVRTPRGYREAYQAYVEGGWPALCCAADYGGQGLPFLVNAVLYEMLNAANQAWTMYPGLAHGAYECLRAHGSDAIKRTYLPKLVSGEWLATMCLTEANAGSDLGLIQSSAQPVGSEDATAYLISGSKIFISGGAHDLTDNIIHLVLARLPAAPHGSKGLSLFLVPQKIPSEGESRPNSVRCDGIERKMGLKGSATCSLVFQSALGWLIGEPNRGLAAMFVMMNSARLQVALQGLGNAEVAFQNAWRYAHERLQMRATNRQTDFNRPADPIIRHPAIRRNLLSHRALVEGERALGYWIAHLIDQGEHARDPKTRDISVRMASVLTPVAKAMFTDHGFTLASTALQVYGGHGYIHDTGIEQVVRDSRVGMIYEGSNEIQAIDLIVRKVLADQGAALGLLLDLMSGEADACAGQDDVASAGARLQRSIARLREVTLDLRATASSDPERALRVAGEYLRATSLIVLAYVWCKTLRIARPGSAQDMFYDEKCRTATYFFDFILPEVSFQFDLLQVASHAA